MSTCIYIIYNYTYMLIYTVCVNNLYESAVHSHYIYTCILYPHIDIYMYMYMYIHRGIVYYNIIALGTISFTTIYIVHSHPCCHDV